MNHKTLTLIHKYSKFFEYVYPILLYTNNKHKILRDKCVEILVDNYKNIRVGVYSNQISKLYETKNNLLLTKDIMRNLIHNEERRSFSVNQMIISEKLLFECVSYVEDLIKNK